MGIGYDDGRCDEVAGWIRDQGRSHVAWTADPVRVLEYMDRLYEIAKKTPNERKADRAIHEGEFEFLTHALALREAHDAARTTRALAWATWGLFAVTAALVVVTAILS